MSGHTPGPWRVRENPRHSPDECDLSICGDIWVLADINGPQYAHQEANARLIAAAPELLEALERAESLLETYRPFDDIGRREPDDEDLLFARQEIRTAIAKATGEA